MLTKIRNRELRIIELLSLGWNIFIKNIDTILMIIFLIDLPVSLVSTTAETLNYREISHLINYLTWIPLCLSGMAIIFIAERYIHGEKIQYSTALAKSFSRLGSGLSVSFNSNLIVFFSLFLFIIPGIIYWIKYYFVFHACVLREYDSKSALDYSSSLIKDRWVRSFFTIISLIFIIFFPAFLITTLLSLLWFQSPESSSANFVYVVICQMILMLTFYLFTVVNTVFFLNLDYRK